jgi:hypothetical protein
MAAVVSQAPSTLIAPQGAARRMEFRGNTGWTKIYCILHFFLDETYALEIVRWIIAPQNLVWDDDTFIRVVIPF